VEWSGVGEGRGGGGRQCESKWQRWTLHTRCVTPSGSTGLWGHSHLVQQGEEEVEGRGACLHTEGALQVEGGHSRTRPSLPTRPNPIKQNPSNKTQSEQEPDGRRSKGRGQPQEKKLTTVERGNKASKARGAGGCPATEFNVSPQLQIRPSPSSTCECRRMCSQ
jgi:hypothetical protein